MSEDNSPISAREAKRLFAGLKGAQGLLLAVSGGPDSVALMWLAARWHRSLARGPRLTVVTIDHGLRPEAAREAREVKRLATGLGLPHRTVRWRGAKPKTGLPAAARDGVVLARPLLDVPKSQLIATLKRAKIGFADDPTNHDAAFTRPRLRALLPQLAAEGGDARSLARLAARLARANLAVEVLTDGAERFLRLRDRGDAPQAGVRSLEASAFAALPEEVRLRLLLRAINAF